MASIISAGTTSGTALNMAGDTSGVLQLATNGSTTAVTVDASQNVGIGTASPSTYGKLALAGASSSPITFGIDNTTASANTGGTKIGFTYGPTAVGYILNQFDGADFNTSIQANQQLRFLTGTSGGTERMRIDSSGFVRVNNTGSLDGQFSSLTGAFYAGAFANTDATFTTVYSWNKATSGNNLFYQFYTDTGTLRGSIDYNRAGNAVRYNTTSDQRLKENIVDAPSAIDLINSVKIRSFDWKETGFHVDYGVIAQELNEVAPDAVSEGIDNEDGTIKQSWGVDTSVLVPALIKAIQELKAELDELKTKVGK
jgi:hypothetical protein